MAGLRIKLTEDKIRGEKHTNLFNIFLHVPWSLQKEREDSKKPLGPKTYILLYSKNNKLWGRDNTKRLGLGAINYGTVTRKSMEEIMEGQDYFSRFVYTDGS